MKSFLLEETYADDSSVSSLNILIPRIQCAVSINMKIHLVLHGSIDATSILIKFLQKRAQKKKGTAICKLGYHKRTVMNKNSNGWCMLIKKKKRRKTMASALVISSLLANCKDLWNDDDAKRIPGKFLLEILSSEMLDNWSEENRWVIRIVFQVGIY